MDKPKNKSINSNAYAYLKSLIDQRLLIRDCYVQGKWLTAELSSGVRFSVKNQDVD